MPAPPPFVPVSPEPLLQTTDCTTHGLRPYFLPPSECQAAELLQDFAGSAESGILTGDPVGDPRAFDHPAFYHAQSARREKSNPLVPSDHGLQ